MDVQTLGPDYVAVAGGKLYVHTALNDLLTEMTPGVGLEPETVWEGLWDIDQRLGPKRREHLKVRDDLQAKIDEYNKANSHLTFNTPTELARFEEYLRKIDYIAPPASDDYVVTTSGLDAEILIPGAEGVHPGKDKRLMTRGINGRWESLYVALDGSNIISEEDGAERRDDYNPVRGQKVIAWSKDWLDKNFSLVKGSHAQVTEYTVTDIGDGKTELVAKLQGGSETGLADPSQYAAHSMYKGDDTNKMGQLTNVVLTKHGLHIDLEIDRDHYVGSTDLAGVSDFQVESILHSIIDGEDSVSIVNGKEKADLIRNWWEANLGTLTSTHTNTRGEVVTRGLNDDRHYTSPEGKPYTLPGRALLTYRTVGLHRDTKETKMVLTREGNPIAEIYIDMVFAAIASKHNIDGHGKWMNGDQGTNIYFVIPKTHGPYETAEHVKLADLAVEVANLPKGTAKIQVMVEEQRTSINLDQVVEAAKDIIYAINSGFLDFTGDNERTMMYRGPVPPIAEIKASSWLNDGYEANTTNVAIRRGVPMNGKGMWTAIRKMLELYQEKGNQILQGATTGWVPNPPAAVLYSLKFIERDALAEQRKLAGREPVKLVDLLNFPMLDRTLTPEEVNAELDRKTHAILAYVQPWIDEGIGCSAVLDRIGEELMEDLATERISSGGVRNWELHDIIDREDTIASMQRMAVVVDEQHADDKGEYVNMAPGFDSEAYLAAARVISNALERPNGYVEGELTPARLRVKELETAGR